MIAVVDAGPLLAAVDVTDPDHASCAAVFDQRDLELAVPALVLGEVLHFLGGRLGARTEAQFVRGLAELEVEAPLPADWERIAELVDEYADFPLGGVDASVIALAERLETDVVITLDHRHFATVIPRHCAAFRLLPD